MTENEVERLVVRLTGDGSSFQKMMTAAVTQTQSATAAIQGAMSKVEGFGSSVLRGLGFLGLTSSLRGAFDQFAQMEQGQIRLRATVESNGAAVEETMERYRRFAEAETAMSLDTKGTVYQLLQQAEALGRTGDAAMRVTKNAMDLADALNMDAGSMLRVANAMESGNFQMLRRLIPAWRNLRTDAELAAKAQELMARGARIDRALFDSTAGKVELLGRSLKSLGMEIGAIAADALRPVLNFVTRLVDGFKSLDGETKRMTATVLAFVMAWLGLGPVTSMIKSILGPIARLGYYLVVQLPILVLTKAAWAAWNLVILAVKAVTMVYNGVLALTSTWFGILTIKTLLLKTATVAWGIAMAVVNGILNLGVIGVGLLVTAFGTLAIAGASAFEAVTSVFEAFRNMAAPTDAVSQITRMLGEWWRNLQMIWKALQTNMPLALRMIRGQFDLMVAQFRDAWPPIWDMLRNGFREVATLMGIAFDIEFDRLTDKLTDRTVGWAGAIAGRVARAFGAEVISEGTDQDTFARAVRNLAIQNATNALNTLSRNFTITESQATRDARAAMDALATEFRNLTSLEESLGENNPFPGIADSIKQVNSEMNKLDAALSGSAEAFTRMENYLDLLKDRKKRPGQAAPGMTSPERGESAPAIWLDVMGNVVKPGVAGTNPYGEVLNAISTTLTNIFNAVRNGQPLIPANLQG